MMGYKNGFLQKPMYSLLNENLGIVVNVEVVLKGGYIKGLYTNNLV